MTSKAQKVVELEHVVVRFAGDSGDGMQLTGSLFQMRQPLQETILQPSRTTLQRSGLPREPLQEYQVFKFISGTRKSTRRVIWLMCWWL